MRVDAVICNGERRLLDIDMSPDWTIRTDFEGEALKLVLQAITPSISAGLIYLFANSQPDCGVAEPLPAAASELLLFAPLVPLVKCPEGFQALSWTAWKEVTSSTCFQDFGMPVSMASSLPGMGEEDMDVASADSISNLDDSEEDSGEDLGDSDAAASEDDSDGCSDVSA